MSQIETMLKAVVGAVETVAKASQEAAPAGAPRWKLRSKHFLYGMPVATDDRYNFTPDGHAEDQPGISVLVREGFAVGHCDRFKVPLWVSMRWTKDDYQRSASEPTYDRPFKKDRELPSCVAEHLAGDIDDDCVAAGEPPGPRSWRPTCRWITRS